MVRSWKYQRWDPVLQSWRSPALPVGFKAAPAASPRGVPVACMTPAAHRDPRPSAGWPSLGPASSLHVPFNLPALVYIASVTIGVLLAAIMKGTDLLCCFLSLFLLQATAGKAFDQCFDHKLVDYVNLRVLHPRNGKCLHPNPAVKWKSHFGCDNHSFFSWLLLLTLFWCLKKLCHMSRNGWHTLFCLPGMALVEHEGRQLSIDRQKCCPGHRAH